MPVYSLSGVEVEFPYDAYPCQLEYMTKVIVALQNKQNALLESPTGTGKTLCLLCATLSWRESLKKGAMDRVKQLSEENVEDQEYVGIAQKLKQDYAAFMAERMAEYGEGLPTIVYSSRTHSQLKQVIGELKRTAFGSSVRTTVLSSRQQTCMHQYVQQIQGSALNLGCKTLVSQRRCKWYNNTENFLKNNSDVNKVAMDIEDLIKVGENRTVCPYYLSRGLTSTSDVIFLPYNYLIDSKTRGGLGIPWENSVLIFDEAHNIESVCSGSASFDLPMSIISGSIEELGTAREILSNSSEGRSLHGNSSGVDLGGQTVTNLVQLQLVLKKLEDMLCSVSIPDTGRTYPGEYILDMMKTLSLTDETFPTLRSVIDIAIDVFTQDALDAGSRIASRMSTTRLSVLRDCLGQIFASDSSHSTRGRDLSGYRVHMHKEKDLVSGMMLPTLSFWCFDPGEGMAALKDMQIRSILLTSGTLSPLTSFANELNTDFSVRLENPHVIDKSQVWVGVVPKGPQGVTLNSSYKTRNDEKYVQDLGNAIVNFARLIPDGILVFFPSYGVMRKSIDAWKSAGRGGASVWERISQFKAPVVEPSDSSAFAAAALEFKKKLDSPAHNGAMFLGVCRGKASEGLDFSDRAGRAVIITGIPFAMAMDPKVKLKKEVMDANLRRPKKRIQDNGSTDISNKDASNADAMISGDTWYVQQAMRAVNQAIGRVIRHKNDYGAIILCDERFSSPRHVSQLSKWLRDDVVTYTTYGSATSSLARFFKEQSALPHAQVAVTREEPKQREAFSVAHRNEAAGAVSSSIIGSIPSAMDAIGIANLVAPVAKMAPRQSANQTNPTVTPSLLSMMGSGSTKLDTKKTIKNTPVGTSMSDIDSLLQNTNNVPSAMKQTVPVAAMDAPWNFKPAKEPQQKRPNFGGLRASSSNNRATRPLPGPLHQQNSTPDVVGPAHLLKQHAKGGAAPVSQTKKEVQVTKTSTQSDIHKASTFVTNMKQELPRDSFLQIAKALQTYSDTKDIDMLISVASRELCAPTHQRLCNQFRERIPVEHREKFDSAVSLLRSKAVSKATPSSTTRQNVNPLGICSKCQKQMFKDPYKSSCCGQIACYSCWLGAVALKKCFSCGVPVKKNMLSQVYMYSKTKQ